MDPDPGRFFTATPFLSGDREPIPLEKLHEMFLQTMNGMNDNEMEHLADFIIDLIKQLRESKNE